MNIDKENIKELLFNFISSKYSGLVEIKNYELLEDYKVDCIMAVPDINIPINNRFGRKEVSFTINKEAFEIWVRLETAISIL